MAVSPSCGTSRQRLRTTQCVEQHWVNEWFNWQVELSKNYDLLQRCVQGPPCLQPINRVTEFWWRWSGRRIIDMIMTSYSVVGWCASHRAQMCFRRETSHAHATRRAPYCACLQNQSIRPTTHRTTNSASMLEYPAILCTLKNDMTFQN